MRIGRGSRPSEKRRRERGFTLLELLVVLVILGLLAAVAAPRVLKYIGSARADTAKLQINNIATALDLYRLEIGHYPTQGEGLAVLVENTGNSPAWNGPYLKKKDAIMDPWGRPYHYRQPGEHGEYDLYSLGADNASGGDGENRDIVNW